MNNRKPAHLEQKGGMNKRERIWSAIRRLRTFTVPEIRGEMQGSMSLGTIRSYIQGLEAAGYISQSGTVPRDGGRHVNRYKLVNDCGVEAPRVRKDGRPVTQGRGREQLWRTMKILREFDWRELSVAAGTEQHPVKPSEAQSYAEALHRAGYLILARLSEPGKRARYRFNPRRDTGPKPPMIQSLKTVYDPNLGKVVWQQEVNRELD